MEQIRNLIWLCLSHCLGATELESLRLRYLLKGTEVLPWVGWNDGIQGTWLWLCFSVYLRRKTTYIDTLCKHT